jgi:NADH-quinone oxidoreductase subunit L
MVWMVFYDKPRSELPAHEAGTAMKVALAPLAVGTCVTWLLAGPFSSLLAESLPFHPIRVVPTGEMILEVITAPLTLIALLLIVLGLAAWWQRKKLARAGKALAGVGKAAAASFGFEDINRAVVNSAQSAGEGLRATQTGLLHWNVAELLLAMIIVLALLAIGAG